MGLKDNSGTLLSVIIGGAPFRVAGDVDASQMYAEWETEAQPTSGDPMYKMTKKVSEVDSIDVAANVDELVIISTFAESRVDIPLGFVTASGATFMGAGRITCQAHSHANNKLPIKIMFTVKPIKVG